MCYNWHTYKNAPLKIGGYFLGVVSDKNNRED